MWVRSQDEELLLNLDCTSALKCYKWYGEAEEHGPKYGVVAYIHDGSQCYDFELGRYFTRERVLEVLEEIEDDLSEDSCSVYYMPLE